MIPIAILMIAFVLGPFIGAVVGFAHTNITGVSYESPEPWEWAINAIIATWSVGVVLAAALAFPT